MRHFIRTVVAAVAALGLAVGLAPSAVAADPVITFTVSGANASTEVEFCAWSGSAYSCDDSVVAYPDNNVQYSLLMSELNAGTKYAVRVRQSNYWTLWWHQTGISTVKPSATTAGEYVSVGASSIDLGTFTMKSIKYLSGAITSSTSDPLGGIQIGIYDSVAAFTAGTPLTDVTTSGDGTDKDLGDYDLAIPYSAPGDYVVGLKDPLGAYAETTQAISLAAANTTANFSVELQSTTVTVGGTVALADGGTPSGVSVDAFLWSGSAWEPADSADSESDGSYQLDITTGRTFTLRFTKVGYQTTWLGGSTPGEPDETNSRVASSLTSVDTVTLPLRTSAFGTVAGQNLSICTQNELPGGVEFTQEVMNLGFDINLFGTTSSTLVVTNHGFAYLSDQELSDFDRTSIPDLSSWSGLPVLAPLWFDADQSGSYPDSVTYGAANGVACIRWNDVGHYSADDSAPNTFQLIITSKAGATGRSTGDVDLTFNYDQVQWDSSGLARVGYTAGDKVAGHYWANSNASGPGVITDAGTSPLIADSFGSSTPGRYVFEIHNALVNTALPTITGSAILGGTLSASTGSWSPTASSFAYQWFLDGVAVSGATSSTWTVPLGTTVASRITVRVTASATGLSSVSATSAAKTVSTFEALQAPAIIGNPIVGTVLKLSESWSLEPTSRSYSWYLNGTRVSTSATYKVPSKSEGKKLTAVVVAKKTGYSDITASTAAVTVLRVFSKQPTPKISGTVKVGSTLSAKPGTWSPKPALKYQWYRGGTAISGATKSKYKVQLADVGQKLSVKVTGSKTGYLTVSKTSKSTKTVPLASMKAATPKITGTATVGRTLKISRGSWTSGVSFTYRWYRSGKLISGATGSTYLLTAADKGKTIKVKVTGTKTSYVTTSKTSKSTRKVR